VEALKAGKVFHDVPADSIEILFQEVSSRMELSRSVSDSLAEQLLQREKISSTGIGNGFAIPHPKTPLGQQITQSMVGAFFLRTPLDFKAPDGLPVFTAFVLLSTDSHHHLLLLSQLARLLGNSKLNELLNNSPSLEILVEQFEKTLAETA
jgi:PTS system nitrogen regulatory IIA component